MKRKIAIALTGASGAPYFVRLVERLAKQEDLEICLLSSEAGRRVLNDECGFSWKSYAVAGVTKVNELDIGHSIASGSTMLDSMVVCPCSMSTLSAVAYGLTENLIHRVASVQLKERRRLILVPRELPLSLVHIRALSAACEAGAQIIPASPSFYLKPESVLDIVDTVVDRLIDQLQINDGAVKRWSP